MSVGTLPDGGDGGDDDGDDRWERVGRQLLAEELEMVPYGDLRDAFLTAKKRVDNGEELTSEDINAMRAALENAAQVVDAAAEASPDSAPAPDMWAFVDEEGRGECLREAERRLSEADETREDESDDE